MRSLIISFISWLFTILIWIIVKDESMRILATIAILMSSSGLILDYYSWKSDKFKADHMIDDEL